MQSQYKRAEAYLRRCICHDKVWKRVVEDDHDRERDGDEKKGQSLSLASGLWTLGDYIVGDEMGSLTVCISKAMRRAESR